MPADQYDVSGGTFNGGGPFHFQGADNRYGYASSVAALIGPFRSHWSANVEYDYYGLGNGNILMTDQFSGLTGVVNVKQSVQVIKVGFNFHIGGSGW